MSLLTELDAFYLDHRCGELQAVEGPIVWMACGCGGAVAASSGRG